MDEQLPGSWKVIESVDDQISFLGSNIRRCGLTAQSSQTQISASAANLEKDGLSTIQRAWYELVERVSIVEAMASDGPFRTFDIFRNELPPLPKAEVFKVSSEPLKWQYAKSSGVAAGIEFQDCAMRAAAELFERDRILSHWYVQHPPRLLNQKVASLDFLSDDYELSFHVFSERPFVVTAIFGFPRKHQRPLIFGMSSDSDLNRSLERASAELLQRLAFLIEDEVSETDPDFSATPNYHQEYFLVPKNHARIRNWLFKPPQSDFKEEAIGLSDFRFVDLTPEDKNGKICVLKAMCPKLVQLTFGRWNPIFSRLHMGSENWLHFVP